jgi:hypothetical protein
MRPDGGAPDGEISLILKVEHPRWLKSPAANLRKTGAPSLIFKKAKAGWRVQVL